MVEHMISHARTGHGIQRQVAGSQAGAAGFWCLVPYCVERMCALGDEFFQKFRSLDLGGGNLTSRIWARPSAAVSLAMCTNNMQPRSI